MTRLKKTIGIIEQPVEVKPAEVEKPKKSKKSK